MKSGATGNSITLTDVRHFHGTTTAKETLGPISLEIGGGSFIALMGPKGSGKTSLLRILAGIQQPASGRVQFEGGVRTDPMIGIVFSEPALMPWLTALENILIQLELRGMEPERFRDRARWLLATVGLADYENKRPGSIPAGLRQRVSLCRALVHSPSLLLLDDPFKHLDDIDREELASEFQLFWMQSGITTILATSQATEAVRLADRVVVLSEKPARIIASIEVSLPRPRRQDKLTTPLIAEYCNSIRNIFRSQGILS
jgi:NitT/TauT family transport system ATP-binding protein